MEYEIGYDDGSDKRIVNILEGFALKEIAARLNTKRLYSHFKCGISGNKETGQFPVSLFA